MGIQMSKSGDEKLLRKQKFQSKRFGGDSFDADRYFHHLKDDRRVGQMKKYIQHGSVNTYEHVIHVTQMSLKLNQKLHVHADEKQLIKGAMLHDYYLYDWHHNDKEGLHGFRHPERALQEAERDFHLTDAERNMIRSHMWPLTLFHVPNNRAAWILCLADKIVSTKETVLER